MEPPHLPPLNDPASDPASQKQNSHQLILISKRKKYLLYLALAGLIALSVYLFYSSQNWQQQTSQQNNLAKEWEVAATENKQLLKQTVTKLNISETQINQLTKRQSSLATEKARAEDTSELLRIEAAKIEDQRSKLEQSNQILFNIAIKLSRCKNNLSDVVDALANNQPPSQSATEAYAPCNNAEALIKMTQ